MTLVPLEDLISEIKEIRARLGKILVLLDRKNVLHENQLSGFSLESVCVHIEEQNV